MATVLVGFLSSWPLGWIAATPSGRIYLSIFFFFFFFFFSPEKSPERVVAADVCSPEVGGSGGSIWVVMVG
jgi:hypothetical protein